MIKYIHCLGTSYTAGGGFEFTGNNAKRSKILKQIYGNLDEELTQNNFSYPGQLQKLLSTVKVINHGKNGYGNDRMYRIVYDIINDNFNKDEHLFLLEFSGLGRKEYWLNEINDYVILNYWIDWDTLTLKNKVDIANSYWYDTEDVTNILRLEEPFFLKYYNKTFNVEAEIKQNYRDIDFFLSYINSMNINYFFVKSNDDNNPTKKFTYGDGKYFKHSTDFIDFTYINGLEIDIETRNQYVDKHNGYVSNKIVGQTIYNSLIDMGFLDLEKVDIDYKNLRSLKLRKENII
jgi:hypothetical protein